MCYKQISKKVSISTVRCLISSLKAKYFIFGKGLSLQYGAEENTKLLYILSFHCRLIQWFLLSWVYVVL